MSVVLLSPPMVKASEPLLGVATLQAYLRAHGVECSSIDANVESQEWLLQTDRIDDAVRAVEPGSVAPKLAKLVRAWPGLRRQLDRLKAELRSPVGYAELGRYRTHVTSLNRALGLVGSLHAADAGSPVLLTPSNYDDARYCDMDSESVAALANRPQDCLFHEYYLKELLPQIASRRPSVVGISLIFRSQLFPGVALAALIRQEMPEVHVTLGGELVSAWADVLEQTTLPDLADSLLVYEGEIGLLALARALGPTPPDRHRSRATGTSGPDGERARGDRSLGGVPNLCWRDEGGRFHRNPTQKLSSLDEVPAPDYEGVPWDLYFAPQRTAPMVSARGCYWNRCTFCPEVINPESQLRLAGVERVCADMDRLHDEHGVHCFHFIDSALPPRTLSGVARHVLETGRPYEWYGFSRLEPSLLRPGVAKQLGRGGCRMLKLGLETASQRLLDGMDKKQDVRVVSSILHELRDAGVMVHAFLMFGTPREHLEDARETERFVADHADCIQFMNCSLMNLAHGSPMAESPAQHGITGVVPFELSGRRLDLALYSNFEGEGWGRLAARRFLHSRFLRNERVRPIHLQTPAHFDSNHSAFLQRALRVEPVSPV